MNARIETLKIKNSKDEEYLVYPRTLIQCVTNEHGANLQELIDNTILNAEGGVYVDYNQTPTTDYVPIDADKFKGYEIDHFATAENVENVINGNTPVAKADEATKATVDSNDNNIVETYATKTELENEVKDLNDAINTKVNQTITINGHALNADVTLDSTDVGADAAGSAAQALIDAKSYTDSTAATTLASAKTYSDTAISNLINGAPTTLDTLKEIADVMATEQSAVDALESAIGTKANKADLAAVATSGKYSDLSGLPTIPTNNNQLSNGAGYITGINKSMVTTALGYTPPTTDTNTTYSAGTGLGLSGTTFSVSYGTSAGTACQGNDSRLSNARPASDVYSWAKASSKPSYTKSEVGLGNVDNTADSAKSVKYATSAGSANAVTWGNVSGKPSSYTPSSHSHAISEISGTVPVTISSSQPSSGLWVVP